MKEELWKPIPGYEGLYEASNFGRIKSLKRRGARERILKPNTCGKDYLCVLLYKEGTRKVSYVHRLVAQSFIPNLENKREVNHINGDKHDNRTKNLEWCSRSENLLHAYKTGLRKGRPVAKFSKDGTFLCIYLSGNEAQRETGIWQEAICACCKGKVKTAGGYRWSYADESVQATTA